MKTEEANADEIIEEATDELGERNSQEERDDDWSPNDLNEEQRQQYQRGLAAVDRFLSDERTKQYEPTDANREKLLAYLEEHDLPMSFGGLYVAFEQLSEAGELELAEGDTKDQAADDEEQPDLSARLATAQLGRTRSEEEPPETAEKEPAEEEEPNGRPGKPVAAWRNGRAVIGVGS